MAPTASAAGDAQGGEKKKDKKDKQGTDNKDQDLLDEKKSAEEALFACMYALVKEKGRDSWQYSYGKVAMEGIIATLIIFNPSRRYWDIDTSFWLWKIIRWVIFREPIVAIYGYQAYCTILYIFVAVIFSVLAGIGLLAWSMRKSDQSKWLRTLAKVLQVVSDVIFNVFFMSILDYFMFFCSCDYSAKPVTHLYFPEEQCLVMSHLIPMVVAGLSALVFAVATVAYQTAGCDLNPCARGMLSSPAATMKIKVVFAKSVMIIAINGLAFVSKPQSIVVVVVCAFVFWNNFKTVPFFNNHINYIWCGEWLAVLYTASLFTYMSFSNMHSDVDFLHSITMDVLYGVWPVLLGGAALTWLYHWYRMRNVAKFKDPNADKSRLKKIHRFSSPAEAELMSRAMRKFNLDGIIDPEAAELGELIIKAGLATFPNSPQLLILYSNFLMEVHKDGPASRTQLQIVGKSSPNFVERYQVFCTVETSRRLKESSEQGMDLHSYVECKRMFRAVLRAHKATLMQLREFWRIMLKADPKAAKIERTLADVDKSVDRTYRVYRKVVERYPKNGKLLKCYGSFLEDVRNDFKAASRVYSEATRQGGSGNGILSMDFDFASQPGKPEMLTSMDVNEDAIVMINAEGLIMLVSQGVTPLFGYEKAEMEGQNVTMLMPQPFSQRHPGYLQRYKDFPDSPRIIDRVQEVVALHKDRHVFPAQICVTKLSGVGADAIFLGLLRPLSFSRRDIRGWLAPNGTIMCCGPMLSALTGIPAEDMVGSNCKTLVAEHHAFEAFLQSAIRAPLRDFEEGRLQMDINLLNKYTGHVPCHISLTLGGTEQTRMFVMHVHRTDEAEDNLLVVDEAGHITFATIDLAVTLGYSLKDFMKLKLEQLLPGPTNAMHDAFLRDAPPSFPITSCRAGAIVNLVGSTNVQVPVRIQISQRDEPSGLKHVTRVTKATTEDFLNDRRIVLTVFYDGTIASVEPENAIFGFPSALLQGLRISDVIDVFGDWRDKSGSSDMQLLMLALLDKENEMPGAAWRVKLKPPEGGPSSQVVALPAIPGATRATIVANARRQPRSVIMQANLQEVKHNVPGEVQTSLEDLDRPRVKLTLWKRELLVGTIELSPDLKVHRADQMAGLILGRPTSSVIKQPLHRFLRIPRRVPWEEMMGTKNGKKSSLIHHAPSQVGKISAIKAFEGDHPDGGSMRILLQGAVVTDPANGKLAIQVAIKPDMSFLAAGSNIWEALGLDNFDAVEGGGSRAGSGASSVSSGSGGGSAGSGGGGGGAKNLAALKTMKPPVGGDDDSEGGEFVKRWVRSVSQQEPGPPPGRKSIQFTADVNDSSDGGGGGGGSRRLSMEEGMRLKGAKGAAWLKLAETMPDEAMAVPAAQGRGKGHGGGGEEGDVPDNRSDDDRSETSSGHDGHSAFSSQMAAPADEILVDTRRGKVLRKLTSVLQQVALTSPVQRLKLQTLLILALLILFRIVFFFIAEGFVKTEVQHVNMVHETALACDRSQVLSARTAQAVYCRSLPPVALTYDSICAPVADIAAVNADILTNILDMEQFVQDVYLGLNKKCKKIDDPATYGAWSDSILNFTSYLDTNPPTITYESKGLWELGNRFMAAARDMLWLNLNKDSYSISLSQPYNFILNNGHFAVFDGFTNALDNMMVYAYGRLNTVRAKLVVLFIIETMILVPLVIVWMWYLIKQAEGVRLLHWLIMAALPPPVLQGLSTRPVKISDDSDDESGDDSDNEDNAQKDKDKDAATDNGSTVGKGAKGSARISPVARQSPAAQLMHSDGVNPGSKTIRPSFKKYVLFLAPLFLWFVALIVVYAISLVDITKMTDPLSALNMAMHVIYRFSHLRMSAFMLVSQSTTAGKQYWRTIVNTTLANLTSEYDTLMYGGYAITQSSSLFDEYTPAAAFILPAFSEMFFTSTQCFRYDQSLCYPVTSEWYEATHHGLDAMMQRVITEMTLLVKDADVDIVYNSSRYNVMYHIGVGDLYEGLQTACTDVC